MTRYHTALVFAVLLCGGPGLAAAPRPLALDDLYRIEELGDVSLAPDGAVAAVTIRAPVTPGRGHGRPLLLGGDRSDIYLVKPTGGDAKRLTDGVTDGAGFWLPLWSPDGKRLALLSTRGGDNVRLYVWNRADGKLRRLTTDGVDLWAAVDPATKAPFTWIDDRRLVCALIAPGEMPTAFRLDEPVRRGAATAWEKAARGDAPTASVLDAGPDVTLRARPRGRLALVDADSGTTTTLADGTCIEAVVSPDRCRVAVVVEARPFTPREGRPLTPFADRSPAQVGVVEMNTPPVVRWAEGVPDPKARIRRTQMSWSPDGSCVAVVGKGSPSADEAATVYLVRPDGTARRVGPDGFRASATARVAGRLLVLGRPGEAGRDEWRQIDPTAADKLSDPLLKSTAGPEVWYAVGDRVAFGLAGGKLVRLDESGCHELALPGGRAPIRLVGPARVGPGGATPELVVECRPAAGSTAGDFMRLSAEKSDEYALIPRPSEKGANLIDYRPSGAAMFSYTTADETGLLTTAGGEKFSRPVQLNTFLRDVADAEFRVIAYRGADGNPLKAHLLLPPGYRAGTRLPTVVWVYAGTVLSDRREELTKKGSRHPLNLGLLAAKGYAVLLPSMPLGPEGRAADPLTELPKGVMPAIDKVVELGIADPDRIAVMGHSYGGYSVYGLLTQTTRFRAGIAMAGITDLVALHGTLDARLRYDDVPYFNYFGPKWTEIGQGRMGVSPWTDPDRYRRNSPITYVDRVHTPLLMIHGDADFVPIQQAEEFYTALFRLGRRARLARYWGESHVFESPANVRDMWGQIDSWLSTYLAERRPAAVPPGR